YRPVGFGTAEVAQPERGARRRGKLELAFRVEAEIRIVAGVVVEKLTPPAAHGIDVAIVLAEAARGIGRAERQRFVVNHLRGRRPDDAQARAAQPDAEVNVVEGGRQRDIESAYAREGVAPHQQAGGREAGIVLFERGTGEVADLPALLVAEGVVGD